MNALLSPERPTDMAPRMVKRRRVAISGRHQWLLRERFWVGTNGKRYDRVVVCRRVSQNCRTHATPPEGKPAQKLDLLQVYVSKRAVSRKEMRTKANYAWSMKRLYWYQTSPSFASPSCF